MEFFDRKEEVIDIQLTQYGKHLLSKGIFRPVHYAFYDDDVIYDRTYGGAEEDQKETEGRIKSIPRIKTQYVFSGREAKILKNNKSICGEEMGGHKKAQVSDEKHYSLGNSLGSSALHESKAPAWSVKFLQNTLSGSTHAHEAAKEITTFEFTSGTRTDYEDSSGENTAFVDITNQKKRTYRFYFDAGNSPEVPNTGKIGTNDVTVVSAVLISSLSSAADIADAFRSKVNAQFGLSATRAGAVVTVENRYSGPAKNSSVSNIASITPLTTTSGKTGSSRFMNLPQLEVEMTYTTFPVDEYGNTPYDNRGNQSETYDDEGASGVAGFLNSESIISYPDGTSLDLGGQGVLLEIEEKHVDYHNRNFDIEVFKVDEDENGLEELIPLYFNVATPEIVNGILVDVKDRKMPDMEMSIGRCMVDYYLNIDVDSEIDGLTNYKAVNILADRGDFPTRPLLGAVPRPPAVGSTGAIDVYSDLDPNEEEPCD